MIRLLTSGRTWPAHSASVLENLRGAVSCFKVICKFISTHPLWRYHLVEDTWENLDVPGFADELPSSELTVSANRLFLMTWSTGGRLDYNDYEGPWAFQVIELKISDMTRELLFEISKADIVEVFDRKKIESDPVSSVPRISVLIGFGISLLFKSNSSGISVAFDLETCVWDYGLPRNPLRNSPFGYLPDEWCVWVWEGHEPHSALYTLVAGRSRCRHRLIQYFETWFFYKTMQSEIRYIRLSRV